MGLLHGTRRALLGGAPGVVYYVDATLGSDANDGRSAGAAWQTIAKVNASSFNPGDSILFKRGETWNARITVPSGGQPGTRITLGAYGTGAKPVINPGGAQAPIIATVANRGYWRISNLDLRCNGAVFVGARGIMHWFAGNTPGWVVENCDFNCGIYLRGADSIVRSCNLNGLGNANARDALWIANPESINCLVEGNTVSNMLSRGIWINDQTDNCIVQDNTVHAIAVDAGVAIGINIDGYGGEIEGAICQRNTVYNSDEIGISLENCMNGPIVTRNKVYDCGQVGISIIQYNAAGAAPDLRGVVANGELSNNLIYELDGPVVSRGIALWDCAGWNMFYNTISDFAAGTEEALYLGAPDTFFSALVWENNIVADIHRGISFPDDFTTLTVNNYNCYHGVTMFRERNGPTNLNFANFQIASGQEANSFTTDPAFINAAADDYRIGAGSPCRNTGVDVGVTVDMDGNVRPQGAGYDIGAYEYVE